MPATVVLQACPDTPAYTAVCIGYEMLEVVVHITLDKQHQQHQLQHTAQRR